MGMYIIVILLEWTFNQQDWRYETNKSLGFCQENLEFSKLVVVKQLNQQPWNVGVLPAYCWEFQQ